MKEEKFKNIIIIILGVICVGLLTLVILTLTGVIDINKKDELRENVNTTEKQDEAKEDNAKINETIKENTNANESSKDTKETKSVDELGKNDTFSMKTESGVVEVIGYTIIEKISDFDSEEEYDYVFFNILETKSNDFNKYLKSISGNSFVRNNAIGLGCRLDNLIKYYNSSDKLGDLKYFELSKNDSKKILSSTKSNPVRLRLERLVYTSGSWAPACYSHITNIDVVD